MCGHTTSRCSDRGVAFARGGHLGPCVVDTRWIWMVQYSRTLFGCAIPSSLRQVDIGILVWYATL